MMIIRSLYVFFVLMVAVSCKSGEKTVESQTNESSSNNAETAQESFLVKQKATPCFGECPVYELTIYEDGRLSYHGKNFVEFKGHYTAQLSDDKIREIKRRIEKSGFFNFEEEYDNPNITDLPSIITTVQLNGETHRVKSRYETPDEVRRFHKFIQLIPDDIELREFEPQDAE